MKSAVLALCLGAAVAAAPAAHAADVAGSWLVQGKVSTFSFRLNCTFKPEGSKLGGVCVDVSTSDPDVKGGKSHAVTGTVEGDKITFTYRSSFLLTKFDVTYAGAVSGEKMSGDITVQGRKGEFTAQKR